MTNDANKMEYTIDAEGKKLGRIASEAATVLMGKNRADFVRNAIPNIKLKITNATKISTTNKKMDQKVYKNYSGYPGGLRERTMKKVVADFGMKEVLKIAIKGMLPKNKLRDRMMKNLLITK
ncbi:MAG: 50S ribosomal protein L13 [Candidatus Zambryskibacteria bacterium RIFCSPLOWO2_01_FULL_39_39]|uniref:50S ribosomal protein L13 n=1 Tax=Candidatus Zambryskibacteria bacterium RIFCSPLOWO2_01_FULL_39_39 TaxID=1802758 RepID=A0A1G2TZ74_9BACT|nr:MAG: 50S ribosomal protein L13 [Parcubacteria group bacterium GW2011_GWA1_38_7]OHA87856.1 MAG: 50S ribosomal protein L13 [Candidatus Zambryskibacteria bacterium RIFCSPHIGHO2_01_FULL_39_63]OHA94920.1 MAG: 50S ribosomal protein L13 [Candidatus Zambryskibacteria bacterium RIFCSPHIGHO2_02_FULL_39_19]OHA99100.1 MAG: 50S ribosomal protein L13 [Candidatus Zambryskibacteria bacterium RIFCSPHIGHO2_12_FULL_39_21]OHB01862.1 MAG: 50S ribosomal protein L13 [Candidatus Zambryskibacteria bacterium RIFCSPLO